MRVNDEISDVLFDELEKKLVWIFGSPRSGSTWLAAEILRHENRNRILDETVLGAFLGAFEDEPNPYYHLLNGNYKVTYRRLIDLNKERHDFIFSPKYESSWKKSLRYLILDRIIAQFGFGKYDNVILKSPNESHASDIIMKCVPKSKLIFLVRDGRDVIDSREGKFHNPGWRFETSQQRKYRIAYFARVWNLQTTITNTAYEQHDPELRLLVRYEDLRNEPVNEIRKIYKFLGYDTLEGYIEKISEETKFENIPASERGEDKDKRKAKPGGYNETFTKEEIRIMNSIMKENLLKFGYKLNLQPTEKILRRFRWRR